MIREARVAARVVHPLICQVYDLGDADGRPFIAMELVAGRVARRPAGPRPAAARPMRCALPPPCSTRWPSCMAMASCTAISSPRTSSSGRPGSSCSTSAWPVRCSRPATSPGSRSPPPACSSARRSTPRPSSLSGAAVDARSDLFSAAVVAFEMLAGRPPFAGATLPALAHAVLYDAPPVLTGAPAVAAADRVLHRALAKAPAERYPTAAGIRRRPARRRWRSSTAARPWRRGRSCASPCCRSGSSSRTPTTDYLGPEPRRRAGQLAGRPRVAGRAIDAQDGALRPAAARSRPHRHRPGRGRRAHRHAAADQRPRAGQRRAGRRAGRRRLVVARHRGVTRRGARAARRPGPAGAGGACRSARATAARRGPRAANEKAFEFYLRGMQLRAEAGALAPGARVLRAEPGVRSRRSPPPGPSAAGSSACSASSRTRRSSPQAEVSLRPRPGARPRQRRRAVLPRAARDRPRPGRRLPGPAARSRLAAPRRAARFRGAGRTPAATAGCSTPRWPRTAPPCGSTRPCATSVLHTYYHQGAFDQALDELHRSSDPFEGRLLGAMGRRDEAIAAARREETRYAAIPLLRAFATAAARRPAGRRRRGPRGDAAVRRPAAQRRRDAVLRGRDLCPRRRHRPRLRDAGAGRGRRLPVRRRPSSATPTWRRCGRRPRGRRSSPEPPRRRRPCGAVFDQHRGRALLGL